MAQIGGGRQVAVNDSNKALALFLFGSHPLLPLSRPLALSPSRSLTLSLSPSLALCLSLSLSLVFMQFQDTRAQFPN